MIAKLVPWLVFVATLGSAVNAGVFYAFSSFVMRGLGLIPAEQGVNAMNAINVTVITPSFMLLFLGVTALCTALAVWALFSFYDPRAWLILSASLIFIIGCFGVTMVFNVPLNDRLAAASPAQVGDIWRIYLADWTLWNTVRTIAPIVSTALFLASLRRQ